MAAERTPAFPSLAKVKHIVLVLSGKGGVGKSSVTTQLALSLFHRGLRVGVLDIDLCGPSIPKMFGLEGAHIRQTVEGWLPAYADPEQRLGVMSIQFLLPNKDDAVVWRGPKKNAMIKQFLKDVQWSDLDYLLIDTPPGTSDEHLAVAEYLKPSEPSAVVVTTPQAVAVSDVRKELTFCKKVGIPVLGIVENMSGFVCPHCSECTDIFASGGGQQLATQHSVPFLGRVPLDPSLVKTVEAGGGWVSGYPATALAPVYGMILDEVLKSLEAVESGTGEVVDEA